MTLPSGTVTGTAGIDATFTVTATKQDNGGTTVTFADTFDADGCTITRGSVSNGNYDSAGDTAVQTYTASRSGTGICNIPGDSFSATEDTLTTFGSATLVINFADSLTPPTVVASSSQSVTANTVAQYRDGITIETTVTDADPNDGVRPTLSYTTSSANDCSVSDEVLSSYDAGGVATATAKVNLLSAGTNCVVTVTPNEQGDGTSVLFTIFQIQVSPLLTIPTTASGTVGGEATFEVTATKQDAGFATVTFTDDFTADGCVITRGSATTTGGYDSVDDTSVQTYTATRAAGAGECNIPNSEFSASENSGTTRGLSGNLVITFSSSNTPPTAVASSSTSVTTNTVAQYRDGITIETTVTDTDPNDGSRPTLSYAASPAGVCSVTNHMLDSNDFVGGGVATATATVNPLRAGTTCVVNATANEGVNGTSAIFTIVQQHVAPSLDVPLILSGTASIAANFTVIATKQDIGVTLANDVVFANVDSAEIVSSGGASCQIWKSSDSSLVGGASVSDVGDSYSQTYMVLSDTAGTCTLARSLFNVTEDGIVATGGTGDLVVTFATSNLAPSASRISSSPVAANNVAYYTDGVTIMTRVTDNDPLDQISPTVVYSVTTGAANCRVETSGRTLSDFILDSRAFSVATATAKVTLLQAGTTCTVTATAQEGVVGTTTASFTINAQQVAPLLSVPNTATGTVGSAAILTVTATKQDAGTASPTFRNTLTTDGCTADTMGSPTLNNVAGGAGYDAVGDTFTQTYSVTISGSNSCNLPKSLFTVTDGVLVNGGTGNLAVSFSASSTPPSVTAAIQLITANTVANYTDGATIRTTVTDGDPNDGARPTLSYTASGTCTIDPTSSLQAGDFSGATATATDTVTLGDAGTNCVITATPNEGVDGNSVTITINQNHVAPLVAVSAVSNANPTAGNSVTVTVTATKQDTGSDTVTFASNFNDGSCSITQTGSQQMTSGVYNAVGHQITQQYSITSSTATTCNIQNSQFYADEDINRGRAAGVTTVTFGAAPTGGGSLTFGDVAMGVTSGVAQRTATIDSYYCSSN